jgi:hypothetical protein
LALVFLLLFAGRAEAATRTWDGGCGAETAWSCAANWSENTVPGAADTALFNATSSQNSTVDAGFAGSVGSVTINTGYAGTVSLARSLSVAVTFTQKTATFTAGGQALGLKNLTLSGGSFTASSGTTSIGGALKMSGASSFNANGGTVNFNGGGATLSCNGVSFNAVTITNATGTKTVGANCSLPLGEDPSAGGSAGSVSLNGTLSGTGTLTNTKTLTLGATGSLPGFEGLKAGTLVVNGTYGFGAYAPFEVKDNFTLGSPGHFTAPKTASFARSFTLNSASSFDANGGTIEFDGSTPITVTCGGKTLNHVTFSAGHKTIAADCTLPLGNDPDLGTGGITLRGTLSGTGKLTENGTFRVESVKPGFDSFSGVEDVGALVLAASAELIAPEGELAVQGNFLAESGASFDPNEGTVDFAGSGRATKTITCNGVSFNLVKLTNTTKEVVNNGCALPLGAEPTISEGGQLVVNGALEGSGTLATEALAFTLGATGSLAGFSGLETGALTVNGSYDLGKYEFVEVRGDFLLNSGATFAAPAEPISFAGDFVNAGGNFEAGGGTVELTGPGQHVEGSTTFFNLAKAAEAEETLTFEAGAKQTVAGKLTLEGAEAGKLLKLVSSAPGTRWLIEAKGARNVKLVSVADSEALGTPIQAFESVNGGNNEGWEIFP